MEHRDVLERPLRSVADPVSKKPLIPNRGPRAFELKPGSDLLSHGEAPHYHRRYTVSLLSSRWDQVVPVLYGRQANWLARANSVRSQISQSIVWVVALTYAPKVFGCYMVKPHGQLVLVSFIHY